MKKSRLVILSIITLCVIIAAGNFVKSRAPQSQKEKELFFPGLSEKLDEVAAIEVNGYQGSVSLSRQGNDWVIDDFDGYPALPEKVKSAVIGVSELRIVAPKTADSQLYPRLGVEDPSIENSTSLLVTLEDSDDNVLASLIAGSARRSLAAEDKPGLYIRKPDSKQSYLVEGRLDVSAFKTDWFERTLFDIQSAKVSRVEIRHSDGDVYSVYKSDKGQDDFELEPVPEGKQAGSAVLLNKFGSLLQGFQANGAHGRENVDEPDESVDAAVSTFEGLTAGIHAFQKDGIAHATFTFAFDQPESEDEGTEDEGAEDEGAEDFAALVAELNQRLSGWVFEIPAFKYDVLKERSASLLADKSANE